MTSAIHTDAQQRLLFLILLVASALYCWPALAAPRVDVPEEALIDYSKNAGVEFEHVDKDGVVLTNYGGQLGLQYNPVYIANAAQSMFYAYQRTGDPGLRERFLAQIAWLKKNAKPVGTDSAAYSYGFQWGELKPGWHSGLAQAQAIGALIRAYYMTKDSSLLPLIQKLKNFMFVPVERGGVMSRTPEGHIWIEEFPFTPLGHVLNGFISVIFALYEYVQLVPADEETKKLFRQCLESVRASLIHYDTGKWHSVDRRYRDPASANYLQTHAQQLEWLHKITGDPFFNYVRIRWLAFNLERTPFNRGNIVRSTSGKYSAGPEMRTSGRYNLRSKDIERSRTSPTVSGFGLEALLDAEPTTYFAPADYDASERKPQFIEFRLRRPILTDSVVLTLYNVKLFPTAVRIFAKSRPDQQWEELRFETITKGLDFTYRFRPRSVLEFRIECLSAAGQNRLVAAELDFNHAGGTVQYPDIANYQSDIFDMPLRRFSVSLKRYNIDPNDIIVLYRCANSFEIVQSLPWAFDFLRMGRGEATAAPGRFCQFSVNYAVRSPSAAWSDFTIHSAAN